MIFETPLIEEHERMGAHIGTFAGWRTALAFTSSLEEALNTRTRATVFDVSHMTRIIIEGEDAASMLEYALPRFVRREVKGKIIGPTAFLNNNAGFVDDVMVYKMDANRFLVIGNAVNRSKDYNWIIGIRDEYNFKVRVLDVTENTVMLALQGPLSPEILEKALKIDANALNFLEFKEDVNTQVAPPITLSKSGWTGEIGFEMICERSGARSLWRRLLEAGARPAGLVARDVLRIEMGYCLYGSEIDENITPLEARYKVFSYKKRNYKGYDKLMEKYCKGVETLRYGILLRRGSPIPRRGMKLYAGEIEVGHVTSGTFSPCLKRPIAQVYLRPSHAFLGLSLELDVRGKRFSGRLADFPFIRSSIYRS
ncbi:MAG: glycine cleavage system aminomethyltransferase GcvT [Thermoprotei archaeon]|nr:MAG: glycine cleavage system aminomethyltransferase GcvT [Thermoprotei archaeon]RLF02897.1 MAG: glycine cleavage system aminomethyltransferase GcvT [Thermoprotei archaeon]